MKTVCFVLVKCAVILYVSVSVASAESDGDEVEFQSQPYPELPDFPEGITVKVLSQPDSCPRVAVPGNWLELEFLAQQMKDDGTILERFDSTKSRKRPLMIEVDGDMKLPGLYEGLKGVCVAEQREITIQPGPMLEVDSKYGLTQPKTDREAVYTVTVRSIQDNKPVNIFSMMDKDKDKHLTREEMENYFHQSGLAGDDRVDEVLTMMIQSQDTDGDKMISFDEFHGPKYAHDEF